MTTSQAVTPLTIDRLAYSINEFADTVGVGVGEIREALKDRALTARRTKSGRLIVTVEDGLEWLRNLPMASAPAVAPVRLAALEVWADVSTSV